MTSGAEDDGVDTPIFSLSSTPFSSKSSLISSTPQSPSLVLDKIPILPPPKRVRRAETISLPSTPRYNRIGGGRNSISEIGTGKLEFGIGDNQTLTPTSLSLNNSTVNSPLKPPQRPRLFTNNQFIIRSTSPDASSLSSPNLETDLLDIDSSSSDMSDFSITAFNKSTTLSPPSFLFGIVVGFILVFLKPTLEFYMEIGARAMLVILKHSLIWGSMGLIIYGLIKFLVQGTATNSGNTSTPTATSASSALSYSPPTISSPVFKHSSSYSSTTSSSSTSSSPRLHRKYSNESFSSNSSAASSTSSNSSIDDKYSYRPYSSRPHKSSDDHLEIISGEDISILEKPIGQSAFRLPRKDYGAHLTIY